MNRYLPQMLDILSLTNYHIKRRKPSQKIDFQHINMVFMNYKDRKLSTSASTPRVGAGADCLDWVAINYEYL